MSDILDRLRAHRDAKPSIPFEIPEWEIKCFLKPISAGRHAMLSKSEGKNTARLNSRIIISTLVDADGKSIFDDDAPTLKEFLEQDVILISRVSDEIVTALGMAPEDPEDDAKNS